MVEINKDTFSKEVLEAEGLVMVDFWLNTCRPCMVLKPKLEELVLKYENRAKFCKIELSGGRRIAISQGVMSVPAVAFYRNGSQVTLITEKMLMEHGIQVVEEKLNELLVA